MGSSMQTRLSCKPPEVWGHPRLDEGSNCLGISLAEGIIDGPIHILTEQGCTVLSAAERWTKGGGKVGERRNGSSDKFDPVKSARGSRRQAEGEEVYKRS